MTGAPDPAGDARPKGPLAGLRVLEFAGLGPAPFAAMLLSDLGAEVLRIDRKGGGLPFVDLPSRGRASLALDLKQPAALALCLDLVEKADVLIEGFRPGVMERLGLGPEPALQRNPRLVYGRMTGWGQDGPLAHAAGHDINYIALSGALAEIGPAEGPPVPPLNLVGDYGGGSLYLAFGVMAAIYERERSGRGQVIDAAVLDGAVSLMSLFSGMAASGIPIGPGRNLLSGAAANYRCYACADGRFVAVGTIEPHFHQRLLQLAGLDETAFGLTAPEGWPELSARFEQIFRTRTRDQWTALLEGTDACVAPVLTLDEAPSHPHNAARGVFVDIGGVVQPAPAPRFSRTPGAVQGPPPRVGEGGAEMLRRWGVETEP